MKNKQLILENCCLIDANNAEPSAPCSVIIKDDVIDAITNERCTDEHAQRIDCSQQFVLPGLIDNHVHLLAAQFDLMDADLPEDYIAIQAKTYMERFLQRGFTTVRDAGGAGFGLKLAMERGLINGPRLFLSCKALSQTGGHGDYHTRNTPFDPQFCRCGGSNMSVIADGVAAVRKMAREQLRKGANQIKIMASGGVSSPTDRVQDVQFSGEEIRAIVEEAQHVDTYVMAHAYAPAAIEHCVRNGVRTIEHGNLLDAQAAALMREHGAYLVPTVVAYHAIASIGAEEGFPADSIAKVGEVLEVAVQAIEIAREAGVKVGFGTDLLGPRAHELQGDEFTIRGAGAETAHQIISSATAVNAEILQQEGTLGILQEKAFADLIVVDGNPLEDLSLLAGQGEHLVLIMKAGKIYKNTLSFPQNL
ncbi:MAG: peptidase M38 [Coxiella sp. (in: Bacteria)]|nr:MAG: peptidase M38 [Coxiella sp. (in: g-proteobacteria)]